LNLQREGSAVTVTQEQLTSCDREPIHIPGSIQPHDFPLVKPVEFSEFLKAVQDLCVFGRVERTAAWESEGVP